MAQYTVTVNTPGGMTDVSSEYISLQEGGKELVRGKLNVSSAGAAVLKSIAMGGVLDFNIFSPGGEKIAYAKKVLGMPARFEIYKEPEHQIIATVKPAMMALAPKWTVYDAQNQPICVIAGSVNPLKVFAHAIYDPTGKNQIGQFLVDLKAKAHTVECSDQKFTPTLILATWLCFHYDTSGRGGAIIV